MLEAEKGKEPLVSRLIPMIRESGLRIKQVVKLDRVVLRYRS